MDTDINYNKIATTIALIRAINHPDYVGNDVVKKWMELLQWLLRYMQWPFENVRISNISKRPSEVYEDTNNFHAIVEFSCNGASIAPEIGLSIKPPGIIHIWMNMNASDRVISERLTQSEFGEYDAVSEDLSPTTLFQNIIHKMARQIHEHIVSAAWNLGQSTTK